MRRRLPATIRDRFVAGERVLAWGVAEDGNARVDQSGHAAGTARGAETAQSARTAAMPVTDEGLVVVTTHRLFAPGLAEPLNWERVVRAAWDEPVLAVTFQATAARPGQTTIEANIVMIDPGSVPAHVRARVEATIIVQRRVSLGEGGGAILIARRRPVDDEVSWTVLFDAGLDTADPKLRAVADAALAEFRSVVGV